jgi:hypothetical protein
MHEHEPEFAENGGNKTLRSLGTHEAFLDAVASMARLPLSFEDNRQFFVHAGVRPGGLLAEQSDEDLLWIRKPFLDHASVFESFVIHGHSPTLFLPGGSRIPPRPPASLQSGYRRGLRWPLVSRRVH